MCLVYSIHKTSKLQKCIFGATSNDYMHSSEMQPHEYSFANLMSYGLNRLGTWCIQFLGYLIYVFYHLEWYLRHCGSHNDMFSICFKSLLSSQSLSTLSYV